MNLFNAYRALCRILTESYSKEFESIADTIEILLNVHSQLTRYNVEAMNNVELNQLIDKGSHFVTSLIDTWFVKEFNDSLMISFNLERISPEEIAHNKQLIENYRKLSIDMKSRPQDERFMMNDDFGMERHSGANISELHRQIKHFGLTNETEIYTRFFSIQLVQADLTDQFRSFLLKQLFNNRIKKRITYGYFAEVIRFRVQFPFEQNFGQDLGAMFQEILDKRISEQLIGNANSEPQSDFVTLCKQLSSRTLMNQELMNAYMDSLFGKKVPSQPCSDLDGLKFVLQWDCLPTLIKLESELKTRGLTRPLDNPVWEKTFLKLLKFFSQTINNIADASEKIGFIKVKYIQ
jgi:hypothetical protein